MERAKSYVAIVGDGSREPRRAVIVSCRVDLDLVIRPTMTQVLCSADAENARSTAWMVRRKHSGRRSRISQAGATRTSCRQVKGPVWPSGESPRGRLERLPGLHMRQMPLGVVLGCCGADSLSGFPGESWLERHPVAVRDRRSRRLALHLFPSLDCVLHSFVLLFSPAYQDGAGDAGGRDLCASGASSVSFWRLRRSSCGGVEGSGLGSPNTRGCWKTLPPAGGVA